MPNNNTTDLTYSYLIMKTDSFALRHLGPRENDLPKMLETIGVETLDQLIFETIPYIVTISPIPAISIVVTSLMWL